MKSRIIKGTENFFVKHKDLPYKEQIILYKKKYNINLIKSDIAHIRQRLNITNVMEEKYILTEKQEEYLKSIIDKPYKKVIKLFEKKYGKTYSKRQITYYRNKWGIKAKTHIGRFKKGNIPYNNKKIGTISYREDKTKSYDTGYYYIKTKKGFKRLGRIMWQKYHHKKIPKGYSVIYLNQNTSDFSKDNLILVKNEDLLVAKNMGVLTCDKDTTKLGLTIAKIVNKTSKIRKGLD